MTKYELREYRNLKRELRQLADERERLYTIACRCTRSPSMAPSYGGQHDPLPDIMDRLDEISKRGEEKMHRLLIECQRIEAAIDSLDSRGRVLMRAYYIEGKSWQQVADMMGYSVDRVHQLHGEALKRLQ